MTSNGVEHKENVNTSRNEHYIKQSIVSDWFPPSLVSPSGWFFNMPILPWHATSVFRVMSERPLTFTFNSCAFEWWRSNHYLCLHLSFDAAMAMSWAWTHDLFVVKEWSNHYATTAGLFSYGVVVYCTL